MRDRFEETDVLVAGAGAAGLCAALAMARQGRRVTLIGRTDARLAGRTVALFEGSLRLLARFGVPPPAGCSIAGIRIIDDTDALLSAPDVTFEARDIGLERLGINVPNDALVDALGQAVRNETAITSIEGSVAAYDFALDIVRARLSTGDLIAAPFVIATDGRRSVGREAANIPVTTWTYPQTALTLFLAHDGAHQNCSTEFLTRSGPFTLVPLQGTENEPHRSSLVWLVSPDDARELLALPQEKLARKIEQQAHRILGRMRIEGEIGSFPMTGLTARRLAARRLALAGEAAHVFPPIAAQGLNLSIRDVATLAECLERVNLRASHRLEAALARYQHLRRGDVGLRTLGVHVMDRLLLADFLPVDFMRNAGLAALRVAGPLRRAVMREGILAGISDAENQPARGPN
ncbi:MAG: 2-octaprenyl-6-methoxyphenol hydroxylase [Methylobacteriaceae bacterium]|nr:2-octaprenyl-6-methoxyphenol hydroxylase [Methylobacteriaceae bacterium]